jgi:hypothetical protein
MSTIRVVNVQHTDATEPNIVLEADGTTVFASGITISGGTNLTVSGTAEFASGTVSSPGITFIDDNNTGIYEPAADTVAITTAATERLRVDNSGNVGIGTTSPSSYNSSANALVINTNSGGTGLTISSLETNKAAATTSIFFADGTTGDEAYRGIVRYHHNDDAMQLWTAGSERLRIDSSGNVGIGTTSPASQMHLNNSAGTGQLRISSQSNSEGLTISVRNDGNGSQLSARGTSSHLRFYTANASNTLYERMRIDSAGRLLLGTDTNGYNNARLQVAGSNSNNYLSILNTTASDSDDHGWSVIAFRRTQSGGEESTSAGITGRHDGSGDDQKGKLEIGTNDGNDNNGFQVRMEMDSTGYVRLTSQSPGLQFNGDTAAANALDSYEEGTWTPTISEGTFTTAYGYYTRIGRVVFAAFGLEFPSSSSGTRVQVQNLPYTNINPGASNLPNFGYAVGYTNSGRNVGIHMDNNANTFNVYDNDGSDLTYAEFTGKDFRGVAIYFTV